MHRDFKKLLPKAQGASQFAIAIFIDIRSFSSFSQETESPDTAMYIKRVYSRLIDEYFPYASFYKPTGDGLMAIVSYDEDSLEEASRKVVQSSIACINAFPNICDDDPMINFPVPQRLGIGIARGTACRIYTGEKTLDYSGRLLNLASRLTSLARPYGVVIDGDFWLSMIPDADRPNFQEKQVYLRGISESAPRKAYAHETVTQIPKENLSPLDQPKWKKVDSTKTRKELDNLAPLFLVDLPTLPVPESIVVKMKHPLYRKGKKISGHSTIHTLKPGPHYTFKGEGGKYGIRLNLDSVIPILPKDLKSSTKVDIEITYTES